MLSNNSIEHLTTYFGVLAYGATICTVHVEMNRNQLDSILPMLKPCMVLCEDGLGLDDIVKAVRRRAGRSARGTTGAATASLRR
jgi:acyl-CoA synthetase (AMP-forming)/AMP-acid ligase II